MNKDSLYAFYGSLRRGMSNYERYKEALEYQFSARLTGFKLYSRGQYPCVIKSSSEDSVVVEVFRVINHDFEIQIHNLEMSEGYVYEEIWIDEKKVGIYVYDNIENFQEVIEGDWVTFFRNRVL
ncbi:MAG TPA: gamma-glutamylcyclotransferase [Cyclobacteriaceae bacterium]